MKKRYKFGVAAAVAAAVAVTLVIAFNLAGKREPARISQPLPHAAVTAATMPTVDGVALLADVRTLASPAYGGRRTGSEGSRLAQAYISGRFEQIGLQRHGASYAKPFSFTHTSIKGMLTPGSAGRTEYPDARNLVGFIAGSERADRYVVVSAHYDHLGIRDGATYHGADDNASGVAAMLALASHFKRHPPRHSFVFVAFDSEELGKQGAKAFLETAPVANIVLNLNLDMVSRSDKNEIFASGISHTPSLRPLVAAAARGSSVKVRLGHDRSMFVAGSVEDWTNSSDHGAFHALGIPYLYFGVEDHADYHAPGDTFEKIDPAFFTEVTRLLVATAVIVDQNLSPNPVR